jgi:hypothetical protein
MDQAHSRILATQQLILENMDTDNKICKFSRMKTCWKNKSKYKQLGFSKGTSNSTLSIRPEALTLPKTVRKYFKFIERNFLDCWWS